MVSIVADRFGGVVHRQVHHITYRVVRSTSVAIADWLYAR